MLLQLSPTFLASSFQQQIHKDSTFLQTIAEESKPGDKVADLAPAAGNYLYFIIVIILYMHKIKNLFQL